MNQACGGLPGRVLGRAGLAGHVHAGDLRLPAGAVLHDAAHHLRQLPGHLRADARWTAASAGSCRARSGPAPPAGRPGTASSARRRWPPRRRSSPPCSGVSPTSRCPIEDWASAGVSGMSPSELGETRSGGLQRSPVPMPNPAAAGPDRRLPERRRRAWRTRCCTSWSAPVCMRHLGRAARLVAEVVQRGPGARRRVRVRAVQQRVRRPPVLQRGRGHDHLEGRARRVAGVDRPVEQRVAPGRWPACCTRPGSSSGRATRSGSGRTTGCWPSPGSRRWSGPGRRPRRARLPSPSHRGLLGLPVERQHDVAAARVAAGEQRGQPAGEQPVVAAGQEVVLRLLHPGGAVDQRVEAGDRRVRRPGPGSAAGTSACRRSAPTRPPAGRRPRSCRAAARTRRAAPGCCPGRCAACRPRRPGRSSRWR